MSHTTYYYCSCYSYNLFFSLFYFFGAVDIMRRRNKKNFASKNSFQINFISIQEQNCQHARVTHGLKEFSNYAYSLILSRSLAFMYAFFFVVLESCNNIRNAIYINVWMFRSIKEFSGTKWESELCVKCNKNILVFNVVVLYVKMTNNSWIGIYWALTLFHSTHQIARI